MMDLNTIELPKIVPIDSQNIIPKYGHFFSDYVQQLFEIVRGFNDTPHQQQQQFQSYSTILNEHDLSFNWTEIDRLLNCLLLRKDINYNDVVELGYRDEIVDYVRSITPIIDVVFHKYSSILSQTHTTINDVRRCELISTIKQNLTWTGEWRRYFMDSISIITTASNNSNDSDDGDIRNILALSIITSGLEQALGNLILTKSTFVPPLLKDLLQMRQLEELISVRLIRLLKVIVGPPITINLRNILWHGFVGIQQSQQSTDPLPKLIDERFYYFLLCIAVSIGIELRSSNNFPMVNTFLRNGSTNKKKEEDDDDQDGATNNVIATIDSKIVETIPQRKLFKFEDFVGRIEESENFLIKQKCFNICLEEYSAIISQCPLISSSQRPLWNYAIRQFQTNNNSASVSDYSFCLIFPLFESALRYLYCTLNQLPDRLMTAISSEYYITFTELLNYEVKSSTSQTVYKSNKLYRLLPRPLIGRLFDVILLPEGLRFRDRLSHGQIRFGRIEPRISKWVLNSIFSVLKFVNSTATIENCLTRFTVISNEYRCLFHPIYQYQTELNSFFIFLENFIRKYHNVNDNGDNIIDEEEKFLRNFDIEPIENRLSHYRTFLVEINFDLTNSFCSVESDPLMLLFRKCLQNIRKTFENISHFIEIRFEGKRELQLRSRQRENLKQLLELLPSFLKTLIMELIDCTLFAYSRLELLTKLWHKDDNLKLEESTLYQLNEKLNKSFKLLLKSTDNMVSNSLIEKNQWKVVEKFLLDDSKRALNKIVALLINLIQV